MRKAILLALMALLVVAPVFFYTVTGLYCKVPTWDGQSRAQTSPGETVWFIRRGTLFSFATTADGLARKQGFSPSAATRNSLDSEFERRSERRVIARFGFSRSIYLLTTDNADFYTPLWLETEKNTPRQ